MKLIPLCCALFFIVPVLYAQDEIPAFGKFDDAVISMTVCRFDKDADGIILFHGASSDYNNDYSLTTRHRIRFKILKEKGIDKANVEIPY